MMRLHLRKEFKFIIFYLYYFFNIIFMYDIKNLYLIILFHLSDLNT
jgi:hypothetical protein